MCLSSGFCFESCLRRFKRCLDLAYLCFKRCNILLLLCRSGIWTATGWTVRRIKEKICRYQREQCKKAGRGCYVYRVFGKRCRVVLKGGTVAQSASGRMSVNYKLEYCKSVRECQSSWKNAPITCFSTAQVRARAVKHQMKWKSSRWLVGDRC